ncbi:hypothetical protein GCM10025868_36340 [Angustibacter aerolatus]|uniref:TerD domain-containing protein n=1 Tax=Angustibacter aerolatus TaxID=1162965 RepID=A0ABQ6JMP1_9ACTN|nr:hypothetical protein [Angustibacter aerolatus]GMA88384.1 hypothetical protein GCM10025868_36340 [Angustibacter aerolatus]
MTLTKGAPSVSLTKHGSGARGVLRVNLNWQARPDGGQRKGLFGRGGPKPIDLDLGCLYEFADGSKGVVQALGNAFESRQTFTTERVVWLDGDDRSGANSGGENLYVDLRHAAQIRRVLVYAYIYDGTPDWAGANGVVTLFPASGPQVEVRLDEAGGDARSLRHRAARGQRVGRRGAPRGALRARRAERPRQGVRVGHALGGRSQVARPRPRGPARPAGARVTRPASSRSCGPARRGSARSCRRGTARAPS